MTFPLPVKIAGMGRCLPERIVPSAEVEALCGLPEGWSVSRNGVKERRWADYDAPLIGDAGGAGVVRRTPGGEPGRVLGAGLETYGGGAELTEIRGRGSKRHPNTAASTLEDQLFHMDGMGVLRLVLRTAGPFL